MTPQPPACVLRLWQHATDTSKHSRYINKDIYTGSSKSSDRMPYPHLGGPNYTLSVLDGQARSSTWWASKPQNWHTMLCFIWWTKSLFERVPYQLLGILVTDYLQPVSEVHNGRNTPPHRSPNPSSSSCPDCSRDFKFNIGLISYHWTRVEASHPSFWKIIEEGEGF